MSAGPDGRRPGGPDPGDMHTTFLAARVSGARLAKSTARRHLSTFRLAGGAGTLGPALSVPAAVVTALRALAEVPAYADFVAAHGGQPRHRRPAEWLARPPILGKARYIDAYPLGARCPGGGVPAAGGGA